MAKSQYYKHPKYGIVYGESIVTPSGRCAWPALVKPKEPPPPKDGETPGQPRYEVTIIVPKSDKYAQQWIKAVEKMAAEMLPVFNQGRKGKISLDSVVADGDEFDSEKYPYYKDSYLIIARNAKAPTLVNGKKQEISADTFTGGMVVRGTVTPLLTGWGLSYKLEVLQLVKDDGTRFAGANRSGAMLDMIPEVEEDEDGPEPAEEAAAEEEVAEEEAAPIQAKTGKAKALSLL